VLRDPRPLPFTPWKGRLGFFDVPEAAIAEAIDAANEELAARTA
jgi:hypothetical protein